MTDLTEASDAPAIDPRDRGGPAQPMLIVENFKKYFPIRAGLLNRKVAEVKAVDDISFYVLKGEVMTRISGQGPAKIYKAGEMFFEPPGSVHEESANPSQTEPAQLLAMIFAKKGSTLTTPVTGRGGNE